MKIMYSGSFDPLTYGHLDVIRRCSKKFDEVVVVVCNNTAKDYLFDLQERIDLIEKATWDLRNVSVDKTDEMLVDYARRNHIDIVVRGLRAVSDYEYEMKMAAMNSMLNTELETFFILSSPEYSFISSSAVKEVAYLKGDISKLVPGIVEEAIVNKICLSHSKKKIV